MESKKISDFVVEDRVEGFFSVRSHEVRESVRGEYVRMEVGDSSGRILAYIWDPDQFALKELEAGMVVKIRGTVGEYQQKLQFRVERVRLAKDDEFSLEDLLPHSPFSLEERRARILALTERIENSYIKRLTEEFWHDEEFFSRYLEAAAGKLWHHAYIGGLADHSANVTELTLRVAQGYSFLDKDLLIFGGLFHDIGKVDTYEAITMIDYTDEGRLIGHICLADAWIVERAARIEKFPKRLLMKLRHMVLSHQGQLDYATPVVPQIPEAFVLYYSDEIDSKMGAIERIRNKQSSSGWSGYVNMLNRFLYFDKPKDEG